MIVSLEGNIGAGKTTLISMLKRKGFKVVSEPLDQYIKFQSKFKPFACHNPLENLYQNTKTDVATAQLHFMQVSFNHFGNAIKKYNKINPNDLIFMERTFQSTLQFIELYKQKGVLSPFVYDFLHTFYIENAPQEHIDFHVYLNVDPLLCLERVLNRKRKGEVNALTLNDLKLFDSILKSDYEGKKLLTPNQVFKVDVTSNDSVSDVYLKVLQLFKMPQS